MLSLSPAPPESKRARRMPSPDLSPPASPQLHSLDSDAALGAAYLQDDALSLYEDHTSEGCPPSPGSDQQESCPGPAESSPNSGSWDLIGPPPAGLSFTPTSHPADSVAPPCRLLITYHSCFGHEMPGPPGKNCLRARARSMGPLAAPPVACLHRLTASVSAWICRLPKPVPAPRPPPLSASLHKPSPLPHALHGFRSRYLQPRLQQGLRLSAEDPSTAHTCPARPPYQAPSGHRATGQLWPNLAPAAGLHRTLQPALGRDIPVALSRQAPP